MLGCVHITEHVSIPEVERTSTDNKGCTGALIKIDVKK